MSILYNAPFPIAYKRFYDTEKCNGTDDALNDDIHSYQIATNATKAVKILELCSNIIDDVQRDILTISDDLVDLAPPIQSKVHPLISKCRAGILLPGFLRTRVN